MRDDVQAAVTVCGERKARLNVVSGEVGEIVQHLGNGPVTKVFVGSSIGENPVDRSSQFVGERLDGAWLPFAWEESREVEPVEDGRQIDVGPLEPRQIDVEPGKRAICGELGQNLGLHRGVIADLSGCVVDRLEVLGSGEDAVRPAVNIDGVAARLRRASNLGGL